ncbi:MAG TPA: cytochrome ubiquinol oxidase subunit I, partial [Paraburkholderia sp.]|nr:cytochrome ubiquinol oxidase subunit I [Paraburkholderia sp.]
MENSRKTTRFFDAPRTAAKNSPFPYSGATCQAQCAPTTVDARSPPPGPTHLKHLTLMNSALSAFDLARMQFAFTVSFHIVFPALSIGLASFIAVLEWRWLKTGRAYYKDLCLFWSKIFAVAFGMGVVSGVVMSYQFGTNWSGFSSFAGPITGPLLMYEVMTAFFLEAGFL